MREQVALQPILSYEKTPHETTGFCDLMERFLVIRRGFEPLAHCLKGSCSAC